MRTLARFPDHGSLARLPVELSVRTPAVAISGMNDPDGIIARGETVDDDISDAPFGESCAGMPDGGVDDLAEDAAPQAETIAGGVTAFFLTLLAPPRRRRPPKKIGWGSIAFLTMIAVGVWTLAWWQSREEAKRPWEHVTERVASQPSTAVNSTVR